MRLLPQAPRKVHRGLTELCELCFIRTFPCWSIPGCGWWDFLPFCLMKVARKLPSARKHFPLSSPCRVFQQSKRSGSTEQAWGALLISFSKEKNPAKQYGELMKYNRCFPGKLQNLGEFPAFQSWAGYIGLVCISMFLNALSVWPFLQHPIMPQPIQNATSIEILQARLRIKKCYSWAIPVFCRWQGKKRMDNSIFTPFCSLVLVLAGCDVQQAQG